MLPTLKQKLAVQFIETILQINFDGDLNNINDVSSFLSNYLDFAKQTYTELKCEYEAYRGER